MCQMSGVTCNVSCGSNNGFKKISIENIFFVIQIALLNHKCNSDVLKDSQFFGDMVTSLLVDLDADLCWMVVILGTPP